MCMQEPDEDASQVDGDTYLQTNNGGLREDPPGLALWSWT